MQITEDSEQVSNLGRYCATHVVAVHAWYNDHKIHPTFGMVAGVFGPWFRLGSTCSCVASCVWVPVNEAVICVFAAFQTLEPFFRLVWASSPPSPTWEQEEGCGEGGVNKSTWVGEVSTWVYSRPVYMCTFNYVNNGLQFISLDIDTAWFDVSCSFYEMDALVCDIVHIKVLCHMRQQPVIIHSV